MASGLTHEEMANRTETKKRHMLRKLKAQFGDRLFVIEEDLPDIGWYLYVYENGKCIADHLQDDLDTVMAQAKDDYGVPINRWEEQRS